MSFKKLFILIVILFLIVAGLWYVSTRQGIEPLETQTGVEEELSPQELEIIEERQAATPVGVTVKEFDNAFIDSSAETGAPSAEKEAASAIQTLARTFVEDYGSYSTNSGYDHIAGLNDDMTENMRTTADAFVESDPALAASPTYYSILTKSSLVTITSYESDRAEVLVNTTRAETDVPEFYNRTFVQDAQLIVIRENGQWHVDSLTW